MYNARPPPRAGVRLPAPGPGHISGPVSGMHRAMIANQKDERQRPRNTVDGSAPYAHWLDTAPFVEDARDEAMMEPESGYNKDVSGGRRAPRR